MLHRSHGRHRPYCLPAEREKHDIYGADTVIIDDAVSAFSLCVYILRENEYNIMIGKNIFDGGRCFEH